VHGERPATVAEREHDVVEPAVLRKVDAGDPYRGRRLRGLLERAGFEDVDATSKFFSYGTPAAVAEGSRARSSAAPATGTQSAHRSIR
jgi:hypothetical protein